MKKRTIAIAAVVVVALLAVIFWFVIRPQLAAQQVDQYETYTVRLGDLTAVVGATGTVRANQSALLSWQTSGTVEKVLVSEGDVVKQGDVLASLLSTSLSQNIILAKADLVAAERNLANLQESGTARAQAQLAVVNAQKAYDEAKRKRDNLNYKRATTETIDNAEANYVLAQQAVERAEKAYLSLTDLPESNPQRAQAYTALYNAKQQRDRALATLNWYKGQPTDSDIAEADARLAVAEAQLSDALREWERLKDGPDANDIAAAQARVDAINATLRLATLTAPFGGTITRADPLVGDQVAPGTVAFRLDDLSRMLVDVQISEIDINSVQVGQNVSLTFDAIPNKQYKGVVREVGQIGNITQGAVNFVTTVELVDFDSDVKPGMTAAVTVNVKELKDVLVVPNRAVRFVNGSRVVYVLKNGLLETVKITLGATSDTNSEILAGDLKVGDVVVLNPPTTMFSGPGGGMMGGNR